MKVFELISALKHCPQDQDVKILFDYICDHEIPDNGVIVLTEKDMYYPCVYLAAQSEEDVNHILNTNKIIGYSV